MKLFTLLLTFTATLIVLMLTACGADDTAVDEDIPADFVRATPPRTEERGPWKLTEAEYQKRC